MIDTDYFTRARFVTREDMDEYGSIKVTRSLLINQLPTTPYYSAMDPGRKTLEVTFISEPDEVPNDGLFYKYAYEFLCQAERIATSSAQEVRFSRALQALVAKTTDDEVQKLYEALS